MWEILRKIWTYMLDLCGRFHYCCWSSLKWWFIIKNLFLGGRGWLGVCFIPDSFFVCLFLVCLFLHRNKIYYGLEGRGKVHYIVITVHSSSFALHSFVLDLHVEGVQLSVDCFPQPLKYEVSYLRTSLIHTINQVWISARCLCYNFVMGGDLLALIF